MKKPIFFNAFILTVISVFLLSCNSRKASLELPSIFSDHMVLQQSTNVKIWGEAGPRTKVTVTGSWGKEASVEANEAGKWKVSLATPEAGGPYNLTIHTNTDTINYNDILIGEVWLCSGQSNMEMPLAGWPPNDTILNSAQEIRNADYPDIRMFTVERATAAEPQTDCNGTWVTCTPETAKSFSATAYFYGRNIHKELGVPVGLIHSSWGGTPVESWIDSSHLAQSGEFSDILPKLKKSREKMKEKEQWLSQLPTLEVDPGKANPWAGLDFGANQAANPQFDDQNWKTMELPVAWEQTEMGAFDGVVWFRKQFTLPEQMKGKTLALELGPIDDMDITYFNGKKVGEHMEAGAWNVNRKYEIPASLVQERENVIAVRVLDNSGGGGLYGDAQQMKLYNPDNPGQSLSLVGSWKYIPVAELKENRFYLFDMESDAFSSRPVVPVNLGPNTPTFLYNGMIAPLVPYTLKGAIWYQGESNVGRAEQYSRLFPLMIENWRTDFGIKDFPFYFVQIAPFNYGENSDSEKLREAQRLALSVNKTGMAVTLDIGNFYNIHPANKQDVGKRLALWALANDYGKNSVYSGPLYQSMEKKGKQITLSFHHTSSDLVAGEEGLKGFEIAGTDHQFVPAKAKIENDKVVVWHPNISAPAEVRYAWSNKGEASLFNREGLPASSFSSLKGVE